MKTINTSRVSFPLLFIVLILSSCTTVYNTPTNFHHTYGKIPLLADEQDEPNLPSIFKNPPISVKDIYKDSPVIADASPVKPKPEVKVEIKKVKIGCDKFVLPTLQPEPIITDADLAKISPEDKRSMINLLLSHIGRSHQQNIENSKLLTEAIAKHEKTCVK